MQGRRLVRLVRRHGSAVQIEDKAAIHYFTGLDDMSRPTWDADSARVAPLFSDNRIGELSIAWVKLISRWVMLYDAALRGAACAYPSSQ